MKYIPTIVTILLLSLTPGCTVSEEETVDQDTDSVRINQTYFYTVQSEDGYNRSYRFYRGRRATEAKILALVATYNPALQYKEQFEESAVLREIFEAHPEKYYEQIVSVMPTPIQSDMIRVLGRFASIGSGWTQICEIFLDKNGNCYQIQDNKEVKIEDLVELLRTLPDSTHFYLIIEQQSRFEVFLATFETITSMKTTVGIGFRKGTY